MAIALVIGATGLVGRALTQLLLQDAQWHQVHLFVRRATGTVHERLAEHIIDFEKPEAWRHLLKGDVLFSALGTTLSKAGSKAAQYKVDYHYQYNFAAAAAANGVATYVLVSAANASLRSMFFYARMKAALEQSVKGLPFQHIAIMRPGLLSGPRTEKRTGERIALSISNVLQHLPGLGMLRPIADVTVAKAMITAALHQKEKRRTYTMQQMFALAAQ